MKEKFKLAYNFACKLLESIVSLFSVLFFSSFRVNRYFIAERKKRKPTDVCVILGNGPSLSDFFNNAVPSFNSLFAVNFFALSDEYQLVRPNNYILLDNVFIGTALLTDKQKELVNKLFHIISQTDWPLTLFFPSNGNKTIIKSLMLNRNVNIVIYNMTPVAGFKSINHWLFKKSLGMPCPMNISNAAIFCALNSGFKKIYLYGVDHSWLKSFDVHPETHRIYLNDGHFYEKENIRWFKRGDYCDWIKYIHRAFLSHFELRDYADCIDAKIINKTPTSFIEAYEFEE